MPEHRDLSGADLHAPPQAYISGIQYVDVHLNDAQIRDFSANGITLVPAPGDGLIVMPVACYCVLDQAVAYDAGGRSNAAWAIGPNFVAVGGPEPVGVPLGLLGVAPFNLPVRSDNTDGSPLPYRQSNTVQDNQPLMLWDNVAGPYTGGDPANTLSIRVWYAIVPAVPFGAS